VLQISVECPGVHRVVLKIEVFFVIPSSIASYLVKFVIIVVFEF